MPLKKHPKHRPLGFEELWQIERIGSVSLAPDGAQAVVSVTTPDLAENKSSTALWLLSTFGGAPRRLTQAGDKDGQPAWSPDGAQIAFIAKREQQGRKDDTPQLYLIAPDGGEARRASDFAPGVAAFKWFPDGKRIAFIAWVWPDLQGTKAQVRQHQAWKARKTTGVVTSEPFYRFWDHALPQDRVPHLLVLEVASGRITDLFEGTAFELHRADPDANAFDIAPDGRHLAFACDPQPRKQLDNPKAIVELDLKGAKFQTLAADPGWDFEAPRYSPDGRQVAMLASHMGKKHTLPAHLALVERGGGWRVLSGAWDHSVEAPLRWDGATAALYGAVYFPAQARGRRHLYRYAIDGQVAQVVAEGGWVHDFDVAGTVLVSVADTLRHPARVHARAAGQAAVRIERFNDDRMAAWRLGEIEEVTLAGAGGDPVQMWLTYPPDFDRSKKYPVLHNIHGGPHAAAGDTFHYRWNTQVLAAHGLVVASVNYHGSSGFGHAFLDSITHRWGELELQDLEAATDWLLQRPWCDKKRICAAGGSYGGYLVAWMNGHVAPGRYQAYVCHAGCFDWTAMFADDAYAWHAKELGAWYWEDPARVRAQSPIAHVAAMQTPTLVSHGALDYRVPDQQGLIYYNTLQAKGVPTRLLWFPDENHWILKPQNAQLWYREVLAWLDRHAPAPKGVRRKR